MDHFRLRCVYAEKRQMEDPFTDTEDQTDTKHYNQTDNDDTAYALQFSGTDILTDKGNSSLIDAVHGRVNEAFQIGSRTIAGHGIGTEAVDGRLNQYIGDCKHAALQTGREADAGERKEFVFVYGDFAQLQTDITFRADQTDDDHDCGHGLRSYRSQSYTGDTHMEHDHQQKVEGNIDQTADHQKIQRSFRITDGS